MVRNFLLCFLVLQCMYASAQDYKFVYYLDKDLVSTNPADAVILAKGFPDEGNIKVDFFYKDSNEKFMTIHFTDSSMKIMQGHFQSYYDNGKPENEGNYINGVENGIWTKWDSSGNKTDSMYYEKGLVYVKAAYSYHQDGTIASYEFSDSLKNQYHYIVYDSAGIYADAVYSGNAGTITTYEKGVATTKAIRTKEKIEAHFPGGDDAYRRYLQSKLDPNTPVIHGAPSGTYRVIIRFTVNIDGRITDVRPETNFGFGMEQEAMRIIKSSPDWVPAKLFGLPVPAYRRSPITFVVAGN